MEINSVAILGAGAVGSYILWGLSNKPEVDVCVIAKGERKERFERDGFNINGQIYHPTICEPWEARGVDLLIVCVKYNSLRESLDDISEIADDHTMVISLMNGVDSEDIIASRIGMSHIVHSLIKVASERVGNSIKFDPVTTIGIIYGEMDLSKGRERTDALTKLFEDTGLKYRETDVILSEIWSKFRLNVSCNLPQAMINCGVGAYRESEHAAFLRTKLREEVEAIAVGKGIDISLAMPSSSKGSPVKNRARYSTLQDLDAKRHTEIDMFSGAIIRMGEELGIPTPYNEFTYHMIKAIEEKNDGKFDYE